MILFGTPICFEDADEDGEADEAAGVDAVDLAEVGEKPALHCSHGRSP